MTMNRKVRWGALFVAVVVIAALSLPVMAQGDLTETYEDDVMTFMYPAEWFLSEVDAGLIEISSVEDALNGGEPGEGEIVVDFFAPEFFEMDTVEDALDAFFVVVEVEDVGELEEFEIGDRVGLGAVFNFEGMDVMALALPFSDDSVGLIAAGGDVAAFEETLLAMAETFNRPGEAMAAGTGEPCEVSTDVQWGATLRVGPGENRGELSTLAINQWFPVTGQSEADDGSLWWQLDKEAVSPGSGAAEIWVRQDQVEARGDCALVGDADAPPIVPMAAPAPAAPASSGGDQPAAPAAAPSNNGRGVWIDFPDWNSQVPAGIKASSRASARVVIQVTPGLQTVAQETYLKWDGSLTTVYRNKVQYTLTAIDPSTNAVVAVTQIAGGDPPPFPATMPINATLNGSVPTLSDALAWIQALLG